LQILITKIRYPPKMSAMAIPHPTKFYIHDQRNVFSHSHTISVFTDRFNELIQKDWSIAEGTLCPLR